MRTVTYTHIKNLVEARLGQALEGKQETRFQALLNDAVRALYDREDFWPRFLRVEPRTVKRGYIADTEDSFYVYGAGMDEVNGLYVRDGGAGSLPIYSLRDSDGNLIGKISSRSFNTIWEILDANGSRIYSYQGDASTTPPENGWQSVTGENPAPIVQELGEIGRILFQWDGRKWGGSPELLNNYRDANGIRSTNGPQNGTVWVAYKAPIADTYGDGTGGTESEIPEEFSRYAALQIRYDMADAQRQSNASPSYLPAYRQVEEAAADAIMGISREGAMETIKNIHRTYYKYDTTAR